MDFAAMGKEHHQGKEIVVEEGQSQEERVRERKETAPEEEVEKKKKCLKNQSRHAT